MSDRGKPKKIRRWLAYLGAAVLLWAGAEFAFDFFPEEKNEFRRSVRTAVESTFPEQAAQVASSYGLSSHGEQPEEKRETLENLEAFLESMTDGLGDGLVTVESTRLDGIDHRTCLEPICP